MKKLLVPCAAALLIVACAKKVENATAAPAASEKAAPATTTAATATAPHGSGAVEQTAETIKGEVLEAYDAPGLTYILVRTDKGDVWTAVNKTKVKVGSKVTIYASIKAKKFESTALQRTFDEITFGSLEGAPGPKPGTIANKGNVPFFEAEKPVKVDLSKVAVPKAPGPNAKTIAEIWASKGSIEGKTVAVRGTVVKSMGNVLGKTWIHLRDGSGSEKKGDHELIVTTKEPVKLGSVIIATGPVSVDEEIGGGLEYPILLQDPKITK